jgi:hypothetical protein
MRWIMTLRIMASLLWEFVGIRSGRSRKAVNRGVRGRTVS